MSVSYTGDPSASDTAAVRFEIGDTVVADPMLQDEEIAWSILQETGTAAGAPASIAGANLLRAAARCMLTLSRQFAAQADTEIGTLKTTYSKQAEGYAQRAEELFAKAAGMGAPYAGGQSLAEKRAAAEDSDRIQPAFARGQFDSPWAGDSQTVNVADLGLPPSSL